MAYEIVKASEADRAAVLALYQAQKGREYCPWDENYPSDEEITRDLAAGNLFVMKAEGRILAAVSVEEDEAVQRLSCWDEGLAPEGELARLAVLPEAQNWGLGRLIFQYGMDELKRRGFRGIHILVNRHNVKAIRCYAAFGFRTAGECRMYGQDFLCYEKAF